MSDTPTDANTSPLVHLVDPAPAAAKPAAAPAPAKAQPSAAAWADMTPDDRAGFERRKIDAMDGTYRAPERAAGVKVDDATYEKMTFSERQAYAASFQDKPATNADGSAADPAAPPVADPNAKRVKIGGAEFAEAEVLAAMVDTAARNANKASLPAKSEDYKLTLPADLVLPEGVTFEFNEKDPIKGAAIAAARNWAKANELTPEQFSSLLGVYAASQANEMKLIADGAKAERNKLGATGAVRVKAVTDWLKSMVGDDIARPMLQTMVTERQVAGFEKIIQKFTNQGGSSFRGTGREAPDASGRLPSGAEGERMWNAMSYHERKEYTERFTQPGTRRV